MAAPIAAVNQCDGQLSPLGYRPGCSSRTPVPQTGLAGAGEGNRTLVVSLEGFCSAIELHPHTIEKKRISLAAC